MRTGLRRFEVFNSSISTCNKGINIKTADCTFKAFFKNIIIRNAIFIYFSNSLNHWLFIETLVNFLEQKMHFRSAMNYRRYRRFSEIVVDRLNGHEKFISCPKLVLMGKRYRVLQMLEIVKDPVRKSILESTHWDILGFGDSTVFGNNNYKKNYSICNNLLSKQVSSWPSHSLKAKANSLRLNAFLVFLDYGNSENFVIQFEKADTSEEIPQPSLIYC